MDIIDKLLKLLNNSNFWTGVSIVVVAITSYTVARYNASKPNKIKIKQLQLDNVYLPLFRLFEHLPEIITPEYATYLYNETHSLLDSHYELVFPYLHKLNRKLRIQLKRNEDFQETLLLMQHQITTDYELLKKALGYPSESIFNLFIRTSNKRKCAILIMFIVITLILYSELSLLYNSIVVYKLPIVHPQIIITIFVIVFYIKWFFSRLKRILKS